MNKVQYYPTSIFKLITMSLLTFGCYIFFVWYRNWEYIRQRDNSHKSSFWRTFFMVFTVFSLFGDIDSQSKKHGQSGIPYCSLLASWFFLAVLAATFVVLFVSVTSPMGQVTLLLVNYLGLISLVPMQCTVNQLNGAEFITTRFSILDILLIFICLLVWWLLIMVVFVHPEWLSMQGTLPLLF